MIRLAGGEGENIIDHDRVIFLVALTRNVAEMRSASDVWHFEERMIPA